ncbi:hypothetical protein EHI8A_026880 [Entamoeba histolytica HM-1:IMSS-B]|uniref:Uncharacterized protein n=6 Tax=Entamoeba histolytica TaxID=5759 RepID=C4M425_ENTH1|nr:hypothetical protein EHI_114180 [Entamoeba histolytica HM-1:IMSS]EMD49169.1 Hypothetical protein EHI5A_034190 [Entamoeba histolytica KU27]EMH73210.1 hypothetical protein EHI8A_026880 [Entamoeba histolytica HM-1:IMSS-B]EMS12446.1 hypothetical protein KM1_039250 [Entamoeba histolytica HM-3:IMSS]ENY62645.1 hypothetical protein EHI7A_016750 [Entamoeba histolytica HM-1:IMSS-A]GAT96097.1 hypothetical protein CL6EHI_114180 [Entamoeba histolytica]|eukprot:XP_651767.1 hypothetical protein EHI_114180 [Entamoeba histolytica HM-1:IMSS]
MTGVYQFGGSVITPTLLENNYEDDTPLLNGNKTEFTDEQKKVMRLFIIGLVINALWLYIILKYKHSTDEIIKKWVMISEFFLVLSIVFLVIVVIVIIVVILVVI